MHNINDWFNEKNNQFKDCQNCKKKGKIKEKFSIRGYGKGVVLSPINWIRPGISVIIKNYSKEGKS